MLIATSFAITLAHIQKVFVYGGLYEDSASKHMVQVYDVKNTKWSTLPPSSHSHSGAVIIGNQFTLIRGKDTRDTPVNKLLTWTSEEWLELHSPMHTALCSPGVLAIEDFVIVSGGEGADGRSVDTIEFLDTKNRKWIQSNLKLPLPFSRHHMALCGEYIYICWYWDGYFCRMNK